MALATWVGAIGTCVAAVIYAALLVYAVVQLNEQKALRRAQTRPFVVVDVAPGFTLYLTVENVGTTMARDVRFTFDPPLVAAVSEPWEFTDAPLLADGVECLPPTKRYRIFFDYFPERAKRDDLPSAHRATVTYCGDDGHRYTDHYTLDLRSIRNTSPEEPGLPELVAEVEKIQKQIARWGDGGNGLLVHVRDKDAMDDQVRQRREGRRARTPRD